ncbi:MAG: hypothetical protein AAB770_02055 [Patescibacteria group bacterium]
MIYNVIINAKVESNLPQDVIEKQMAITLRNKENQYSEFEAIDYELAEVREICPHCEVDLVSRIFDIDGTNLVEHDICNECGYGTPALI